MTRTRQAAGSDPGECRPPGGSVSGAGYGDGDADADGDAGADGDAEAEEDAVLVLPVLVVRNTGEPVAASLPAGGSWATITPAGTLALGASSTPPRTKPAFLRVLSALG